VSFSLGCVNQDSVSTGSCQGNIPMDLMHDLMEGVVTEDLLSKIRILSLKGWFTIDAYNNVLRDFGWPSYETGDKPQSVQIGKKKCQSCEGKQCLIGSMSGTGHFSLRPSLLIKMMLF
jgi:hypothetical protein